ncbi:sensor histidine kinase [Spongiibacter tropicus]|uniref:sensor histidine kinase n=1 Tax=Spongiibacter tropicus TaxID=454602 RepID=UPI003A9A3D54
MHTAYDPNQRRAVMRIYATYRLLLAGTLFLSYLLGASNSILGSNLPGVFMATVTAYLGFSLLVFLQHLLITRDYSDTGLFFEFFVDIGSIMLMSYCSTSTDSGLTLLLIVSISAASMTLPARLCLSLASLATIAGIGEVAAHTLSERVATQQFVISGMMGIAYFSTAIAIRHLSARIVKAQGLAESRRNDLEQLSQINQSIVQRMQTGILVMSRTGRIKLSNAAAIELLQLPADPEKTQQYAPPQLIAMSNSGNGHSTIIQLQPSGVELHVNLTYLAPQHGDDVLMYIENISKINQRAQNLKLASLGRFTASIAHEIRNPLAAISHAAQLLRESPDLISSDARFVAIIQSHANRMNDIIKNILELSRGRLAQPRQFALRPWLETFCRDWHGNHPDKTRLQIDANTEHDTINVDQSQLSQIISNIVENGIRHGIAAHGEALIQFQLSHTSPGGGLTLDIIDNGPGIDRDDEDKIFEPFFTTQTQGNGLGLYLCRELCLANQIAISYRRDNNGASCFRLQFAHPERGTIPE